MKKKHLELPDCNQNIWSLSLIQLAGMTNIPILTTSILIASGHSFLQSLFVLVLGNIILWLIRVGVISLSKDGRKSTLDIAKDYLGNIGGYFVAVALLLSTLIWFVAQTTLAAGSLTSLIPINEGPSVNTFLQVSILLGVLSTLFCMEGIIMLRRLSVICFPIIFLSLFMILILYGKTSVTNLPTKSIAAWGLPLVVMTNLGVSTDIPTFFRHSKSYKTSLISISIIQIVGLVIGVGALFLGTIFKPWVGLNEIAFLQNGSGILYKIPLISFILVSSVCANVANVYSASVAWEVVAPILATRKEYLILGFTLTIIFILFNGLFFELIPMNAFLDFVDSGPVNLCLIFLVGYLMKSIIRKKDDKFLKLIYLTTWLLASILGIAAQTSFFPFNIRPFELGLVTILFGAAFAYITILIRRFFRIWD